MFDVNYLPGWLSGIRDVAVMSGAPPEQGASVALLASRGAARPQDVFEILEHQPDLTLVLQSETRTLTLALEGVPVGTVAWLAVQTERSGLRRMLSALIDRRTRRTAIRDLRRLKQFIETGEYRTWWVEAEA